jgi:hypothetical protein
VRFLILFFLIFTLTGCWGPLSKNNSAEKAVEKAKVALAKNKDDQVDHSKGYFWGSGYSLSQVTNPSPEVKVAKDLNDKGLAIVGPPSIQEINDFKSIVDRLLSDNEKVRIGAQNDLKVKDGEIISLQVQVAGLEKKIDQKEQERKEIAAENAKYANTWVNIKRVFYWGLWICVGVMVLRVVCAVVPPPYNSIGYAVDFIFGGLGRIIFGIFSKAKDAAGVVSKQTYDLSQAALIDVVGAINEIKRDKPDLFQTVLKPRLDNHTDKDTTRVLIKDLARKA